MNIYLIKQMANNDYDTFDAAVVCAENADEARTICPQTGKIMKIKKSTQYEITMRRFIPENLNWCESPDQVLVVYLGNAKVGLKKGVLLSSYNAG